jgi:hypothetical protein
MSLQAEVSRSRHAQRSHQKQTNRKKRNKPRKQQPLVALPAVLNDNQCLTFREWCGLGRFSPRTGRRIIASGNGPVVTQLSPKRIGITVANDRVWKASRERA